MQDTKAGGNAGFFVGVCGLERDPFELNGAAVSHLSRKRGEGEVPDFGSTQLITL
jgi:hypothetical protein